MGNLIFNQFVKYFQTMKKYGRRGMFGSADGHGASGHHHSVHHDDSSEYKDAYSNLSKSALV